MFLTTSARTATIMKRNWLKRTLIALFGAGIAAGSLTACSNTPRGFGGSGDRSEWQGRMIEKVADAENPADLMTKHLDGPLMEKTMGKLGAQTRSGRAEAAPDVVKGEGKAKTISEFDVVRGDLFVDQTHLCRHPDPRDASHCTKHGVPGFHGQ